MENLNISATIAESKLLEFKQSKQIFLQSLQSVVGYISYTEIPGSTYHLSIGWNNRAQLDEFMSSELYQYLHGAIITLGKINSITIKSVKDNSTVV